MRVKIGNEVYDSLKEPIMIIFDEGETDFIGKLGAEQSKYCSYPPEGYKEEEIEKFMELNEKGEM